VLEPYDVDGTLLPDVAADDGRAALLRDTDRADAWLLTVAEVAQSYVDLADPTHLEFDYVRLLGDVVDTAGPAAEPLAVIHLGGGAATLARYVAATRPGSTQLVVEADATVAALVESHLGRAGFALRVGDARAELAALPAADADLVVLDAFCGSAVPPHLTTEEHVAEVRRVLRPGGGYALNLADGAGLAFVRAAVRTLRAAFPEVALLAPPAVLRGRRFGNVVLVGSDAPLPADALARRAAGRAEAPARLLAGDELDRWSRETGATTLTDATAESSPVPPPGSFWRSGGEN
jgi:spermidine synthase